MRLSLYRQYQDLTTEKFEFAFTHAEFKNDEFHIRGEGEGYKLQIIIEGGTYIPYHCWIKATYKTKQMVMSENIIDKTIQQFLSGVLTKMVSHFEKNRKLVTMCITSVYDVSNQPTLF